MKPATILVVEDNPITRKMIRVALASDGYTVLDAADGKTALEIMADHAPDLILQDLLLPDMDGFDLFNRFRGMLNGAAVPILAISGFLAKMEQARSLHLGFTDYLFKPVEPSHLLLTVRAYLKPQNSVHGRPGRGRRILLVDDDPIQLKLLKLQLEYFGFQVTTAENGADALAKARASPPDALLSDVLMPHMDGFRLCLAVRQDVQLAHVPVVLMSAVYNEDPDRQLAQVVGANAFLQRSPDNQELADALQTCLDAPPARLTLRPVDLAIEEYTHRVIRLLEHQVGLTSNLTCRLALLEAEIGILVRIVETLKKTSLIDAVLDELLYRCLDAAGVSQGATFLLEPDGQLTLRARLGYSAEAEGPLMEFFGHSGLLRHVMAQGEPVEVGSGQLQDEGSHNLLAKAGAKSLLLAPLVWGEKCLGVLEMASANRVLGPDWLAFAKVVGSQIGQAIELARTLSQLSASEQRYRDLVHGTGAIVWEADAPTGRFTFVSRGEEDILGYPVAQWLAEPNFWPNLIYPEDRSRTMAQCQEAVRQGRDHVLEYRVVAADGRLVWVHDTVRVIRDSRGRPHRLRGVMIDITERKRVEEQEAKLRLAREIQERLFPSGALQLPGFDIGGVSYPADVTGGDYFDYIPLGNGSMGIAIGDVTGHGFGPALLMAETRAYLRALALTHADIGDILTLLNRALAVDIAEDYYVTLLLAQLDPRTCAFRYASAGHPSGYILDSAGAVKAVLDSTDLPLGILPGTSFATSNLLTLEPSDLVLFLTDGIVEAQSPDDILFGTERALEQVRLHRHAPARQIVNRLYDAVRGFSQNRVQDDDITAVVIKVEGDRQAAHSQQGPTP
jgi:PAS domain S-box-containing protein